LKQDDPTEDLWDKIVIFYKCTKNAGDASDAEETVLEILISLKLG
jgi:hypothetical protein